MGLKHTLQSFIDKANKIHYNRYDYSKTDYINMRTDITIICKTHGEFKQSPHSHLKGRGCIKCTKTEKLNKDVFVERANIVHHNKYDYSKTNYVNIRTGVTIICRTHGEFNQSPHNHLSGHGCSKCNEFTRDQFINKSLKIHNNKYDYSLTKYVNSHTKIKIICPEHGVFEQRAISHSIGKGCLKCKSSKGEIKIMTWLDNNNVEYVTEKKFSDCKDIFMLPFDFYIPSLNMCIEYDGELHFIPFRSKSNKEKNLNKLKTTQYHDEIKNTYCVNNGIRLVRIPYTELDNMNIILQSIIHIH